MKKERHWALDACQGIVDITSAWSTDAPLGIYRLAYLELVRPREDFPMYNDTDHVSIYQYADTIGQYLTEGNVPSEALNREMIVLFQLSLDYILELTEGIAEYENN